MKSIIRYGLLGFALAFLIVPIGTVPGVGNMSLFAPSGIASVAFAHQESQGYHGPFFDENGNNVGGDYCWSARPSKDEIIDHMIGHCNRWQLAGLILIGLAAIAALVGIAIASAPAGGAGFGVWLAGALKASGAFGALLGSALAIIGGFCGAQWRTSSGC